MSRCLTVQQDVISIMTRYNIVSAWAVAVNGLGWAATASTGNVHQRVAGFPEGMLAWLQTCALAVPLEIEFGV